MRLLLVVEEENLGGAELSFLELARSLATRVEVHLALGKHALQRHSAVYTGLAQHGVTLHPCTHPLNLGTVSNLHRILRQKAAREVAGLIGSVGPTLILVNLPTVERGQAIVDAVGLVSPRLPVWGLLHLVQRPSVIGARLGRVRDVVVKTLLQRFDRLLTVSETGAEELSRRYGLARPDVIRPPTAPLQPVPAAAERARRRTELGLPHGLLVGIVGRVQLHQKGHDTGLRVLGRLRAMGLSLNLVIIGDGPDLPRLRRMAGRMGLTSYVTFLGWRSDVGELIPLLDAVLLPSRFEGLPQAALQAATAEVPVVAYGVDGLRELLPPEFQVAFDDERGLVTTLREVLRGTRVWPWRKLAERAAEWGDPDRGAERILNLLRGSGAYSS
jgi:glycosyltransferase involved in cell wall biosynthesis